ncbi:MAG: ABC transporter permease, partial [Candidatus Dormibacteraeota bacterium]|nr:ABC transporter permease [Candidatus Dormibacteraeota bacterium]
MNTAIETAPLSRPVALPEPRPTFAGSVRGEVLKLSRQRGTWAMLGLALLLYLLVTAALFGAAPFKRTLAISPTQFLSNLYDIYLTIFDTGSGIFLLLLSARLVGMEYSGGTIRVLLARGAGRLRLLAAKLAALALVAVGLLTGFLALTSATVYLVVVAWAGSFRPLSSLPGHLWHDLATEIVVALVSMAAAIVIGTTASVVGRSVAFGIGAAL